MGIFGGTPKPDYSAINAQKEAVAKQQAELDAQEEERKQKDAASLRARGNSSSSTLLTGLETGVQPVTGRNTLG